MINPKVGERCRYKILDEQYRNGTIIDILPNNRIQIDWDEAEQNMIHRNIMHRTHLIRLKPSKPKITKETFAQFWDKHIAGVSLTVEELADLSSLFKKTCEFLRLK